MTEQAKTDTEQTQLVVIEPTTAVALFTKGDGINAMLADIRQQAASLVPDITTAKGRKEIASVAYAVAKTKTYLDGLGKDLTDKYKEIPKRIDANRKLIRDTLDTLKDEVRAPLTQYEEAEEARVEALKSRLGRLNELAASASIELSVSDLQAMLLEVGQTPLDDTWQELLPQATVAKELAAKRLGESLAARQKYEAEQAELEQLRQKQAEQDRIDRERQIAEQAAEQARLQEENRQRLEREAAQHREQEAQRQAQAAREREEQARRDAEAAELARQQAEANAARQAEEAAARAAEQERQRIEHEQRMKAEEDAARAADVEHRRTINNAILMDLMGLGIEEDKAINLIKHIAGNKIDHLTINY
ncbi:cell envelope integrity protein TolA [Aeromonas hydrophila]|uniref:cell envelope integrity protein TolA n=1 Tax=Aeromonas hydrophila TaxID=644 RepID=UPI00235E54A8|nr:cell envelope integrity protein TolA [Aeromonas hydrophila]